MPFFTCLLDRNESYQRSWRKSECIEAPDASDAAERYCRHLFNSGGDLWEPFEDQVPVTVRVIDGENQHTDFLVTPIKEFLFSADELEKA